MLFSLTFIHLSFFELTIVFFYFMILLSSLFQLFHFPLFRVVVSQSRRKANYFLNNQIAILFGFLHFSDLECELYRSVEILNL